MKKTITAPNKSVKGDIPVVSVAILGLLMSFGVSAAEDLLAASDKSGASKVAGQSDVLTAEVGAGVDFFTHSVSVYASKNIKFGPKPVSDVYIEYEYYGRQGPFELYGYVDLNKAFNWGNHNDHGVWDDGSPIFMEHEPRVSIDSLMGRSLAMGPFKEFYVAFDWLYDLGDNKQGRSNVLYSGLGVDIDTHTPINLAMNFYARRNFENYGLATENSWDGYRAQLQYNAPIKTFDDGSSLGFVGYTNYDYDSDLPKYYGSTFKDNSLVSASRLVYLKKHLRLSLTAYYFHNSGNFEDGTELDFGEGPFKANSNGLGYTVSAGYQF
jgi:nucleoside-specific channel-forming protein